MMPSPFLSPYPRSGRDHQPLRGYPSRSCCVLLRMFVGTPPRLTSRLRLEEPLRVRSQPKELPWRSTVLMRASTPVLRTSPRFSKRDEEDVVPVPNDGGR